MSYSDAWRAPVSQRSAPRVGVVQLEYGARNPDTGTGPTFIVARGSASVAASCCGLMTDAVESRPVDGGFRAVWPLATMPAATATAKQAAAETATTRLRLEVTGTAMSWALAFRR